MTCLWPPATPSTCSPGLMAILPQSLPCLDQTRGQQRWASRFPRCTEQGHPWPGSSPGRAHACTARAAFPRQVAPATSTPPASTSPDRASHQIPASREMRHLAGTHTRCRPQLPCCAGSTTRGVALCRGAALPGPPPAGVSVHLGLIRMGLMLKSHGHKHLTPLSLQGHLTDLELHLGSFEVCGQKPPCCQHLPSLL